MPFLGQDWRSPGEQWIRTDDGWQKMKIWRFRFLENLNESIVSRLLALLDGEYHDVTTSYQPYAFVPSRISRENNFRVTLCDGLNRLDIIGGVKDRKRQDYVWKLLQLLVKNKLCYMSGDAQRQLFYIIEQLLNQVIKTQMKPLQMQTLLTALGDSLVEHKYGHLGSQQLWQMHAKTLGEMKDKLNTMQIDSEEEHVTLSNLPEDVLRHIIHCLSDHSDIMRVGMTNKHLLPLAFDKPLWRKLCQYHFNQTQIEKEVKRLKTRKCNNLDNKNVNGDSNNNMRTNINEGDWRVIYRNLHSQFGKKEDYADSIYMCNFCSCLFWKHLGHPCIVQTGEVSHKMVSPQDFINLFSV